MAFGVFILALAGSPNLTTALVLIFPMGAASIAFIATANATLQLRADPSMRGRVMALYAIAFLGTTPIGSPLVGWISQAASPRVALAVGGTATVVASAVTRHHHRRQHQRDDAVALGPDGGVPPGEVVEEAEPGTELGVA
jgi:MFS family permease